MWALYQATDPWATLLTGALGSGGMSVVVFYFYQRREKEVYEVMKAAAKASEDRFTQLFERLNGVNEQLLLTVKENSGVMASLRDTVISLRDLHLQVFAEPLPNKVKNSEP